jgi:HPt (histidine-containing phosphotransfer) domain-containing protein
VADEKRRDPAQQHVCDDRERRELLESFVREVPEQITSIDDAMQQSTIDEISRLALQLRGEDAASGHAAIGEAAARLESRLQDGSAGLDAARRDLEALVELCNRALS